VIDPEKTMHYEVKPLGCEPGRLQGLSEKLIVSHYENNASTRSWGTSIGGVCRPASSKPEPGPGFCEQERAPDTCSASSLEEKVSDGCSIFYTASPIGNICRRLHSAPDGVIAPGFHDIRLEIRDK
jgi:hypothetical protein